jgi:hypothetical protein
VYAALVRLHGHDIKLQALFGSGLRAHHRNRDGQKRHYPEQVSLHASMLLQVHWLWHYWLYVMSRQTFTLRRAGFTVFVGVLLSFVVFVIFLWWYFGVTIEYVYY